MIGAVVRLLTWLGVLGLVIASLLLLDGSQRTAGFRAAVVVLAVFALRLVASATADANPPPPESPFAGRRRRLDLRAPWRRRARPARRTPADNLVLGSTERAGQFHHRLRPALRHVADERLRAHVGIGIDDPRAAEHLGPVAWELLGPDRPAPEDRRAAGPDAATLDQLLAAVEAL